MAIMDVMAIAAVMSILTKIARMATMTLIISVNMIASTIMRVAILLFIISDMDMVIMASVAITCVMATLAVRNYVLCNYVMTKNSLVALL